MQHQSETTLLTRLMALVEPGDPTLTDPGEGGGEPANRTRLFIPTRGWYVLKQTPDSQTGLPCDQSVSENSIVNTGSSKITVCGGIHFKFNPKQPAVEYAIHQLDSCLFGEALSNPSLFIQVHSPIQGLQSVLATQTVFGQTVLKAYQQQPNDWINSFSHASFSQQVILQCLIGPGDGKLDNFMVGAGKLWAIDNEISFEPEVVKRVGTRGHVTHLHCFLWLLPAMKQPLDKALLTTLKTIDIPMNLLNWLQALAIRDAQYEGLAVPGYAPLRFPPRFIPDLIQRLQALQNLLAKTPNPTGHQVFQALLPDAFSFYQGFSQRHGQEPLTQQMTRLQSTKLQSVDGDMPSFERLNRPVPQHTQTEEDLETQKQYRRLKDPKAESWSSPTQAMTQLDRWVESLTLSPNHHQSYIQARLQSRSQIQRLSLQGQDYTDAVVLSLVQRCAVLQVLHLNQTLVTVEGLLKTLSQPACVSTQLIVHHHTHWPEGALASLMAHPLVSKLAVVLPSDTSEQAIPLKPGPKDHTKAIEALQRLHTLFKTCTWSERSFFKAVERIALSVGYAEAALQALPSFDLQSAWAALLVRYQVQHLAEAQAEAPAYLAVYTRLHPLHRKLFYQYLNQLKDKTLKLTLQTQLASIPDPNGDSLQEQDERQTWLAQLTTLVSDQPGSITIQLLGADTNRAYLAEPWIQQLIKTQWLTPAGELNLLQKLHTEDPRLRQGNHMVFPLRLNNGGVHIKYRPDFPGMELAYQSLSQRVVGTTSPRVALWIWQQGIRSDPILISETIEGEPLTADNSHLPVDRLSYQALVLMALLTQPGDGNPGNFMAQPIKRADGSVHLKLLSIDNDRLFAPAFEGGKLRAASLLYCMDPVKEPLLPALRQRLLSLDVYTLLQAWLDDMDALTGYYLKEVQASVINDGLNPEHRQPSYLLPLLTPNTLTQLFRRLKTLQYWLLRDAQIPLLTLLSKLSPSLANHYQRILEDKTLSNPLTRFEAAVQNEYRKDVVQGVKRYTSTLHMTQYLALHDRNAQTTVTQAWAYDLKRAKDELWALNISQLALHHARAELMQERVHAFSTLPSALAQSEVLTAMVWDEIGVNDKGQPDLVRQDRLFQALLPGLKSLETLIIQYAMGLTPQTLGTLLRSCPHLKTLKLVHCPQIGPVLASLHTFKLSELTELTVEHCGSLFSFSFKSRTLTYLALKQNTALHTLKLKAPRLKALNLAHSSIQTFSIQAPVLTELDLSHNLYVTDLILRQIVELAPGIQQINLSGCNPDTIQHGAVKAKVPLFSLLVLEPEELQSYAALLADLFSHAITDIKLKKQTGLSGLAWRCIGLALKDNTSVTGIELEYCDLNDVDAEVLAEVILHHPALKAVSIMGTRFTAQAAKRLARALSENQTLTRLNIGSAQFGLKGAQALGQALASHPTLKELDLAMSGLGDQGAEALIMALAEHGRLTELNLLDNDLGQRSAQALAKFLRSQTGLTYLNLNFNPDLGQYLSVWVDSMMQHPNLTTLDLGGCGLNSKALTVLCEAWLPHAPLKSLSLSFNSITDRGAEILAKLLATNPGLETLNLSCNQIGDRGVLALVKALSQNTQLKDLDLKWNAYGPVGSASLKTLTQLEVRFDENGVARALAPVARGTVSAGMGLGGRAIMTALSWTDKALHHQGQSEGQGLALLPYTFFAQHLSQGSGFFHTTGLGLKRLKRLITQWEKEASTQAYSAQHWSSALQPLTQCFALTPAKLTSQSSTAPLPQSLCTLLSQSLVTSPGTQPYSAAELRVLWAQHVQDQESHYLSFTAKGDWDEWVALFQIQAAFSAKQVLKGLSYALKISLVVFRAEGSRPWVFKQADARQLICLLTLDDRQFLRLEQDLQLTPQLSWQGLIEAVPVLPNLVSENQATPWFKL